MEVKPLHDHIVVRYLEDAGTSSGGLHLPVTDPTAPARAEVLAMGPGRYSLYTGQYDSGILRGCRPSGPSRADGFTPTRPIQPKEGAVDVGSIVWVRGGKQGRKMTQDGEEVYYIVPEELMAVEVE